MNRESGKGDDLCREWSQAVNLRKREARNFARAHRRSYTTLRYLRSDERKGWKVETISDKQKVKGKKKKQFSMELIICDMARGEFKRKVKL